MENSEYPAFPIYENNGLPTGLTKLEYASIMAMQGLLANEKIYEDKYESDIVKSAVSKAKALLLELEQTK